MTTLLYDLETDGLLKKMTRIHLLIIQDVDTKEVTVYRRNDEMDNIEEGIRRLEEADVRGGHNIIRFDELAIKKIYPWYNPKGKAVDTLVLVRVIYPDIKQRDFALNRKGVLPGQLIGSHSLDAWGYRMGLAKGDYSKQMLAKGLDPWAKWNQEMEDYAIRDVEITAILWAGLIKDLEKWGWDPTLEHEIHDLTGFMERSGTFFDRAAALKLRDQLESEFTRLVNEAKARYGYWYGPEKKKVIRPLYPNAPIPEGKVITYGTPNVEWGEDDSRAVWADITFPKINRKSAKLGDMSIGAPFCKIVRKDFNPASRQHIIDRFTVIHQWSPEDFTENGNPSVDDAVLQKLKDRIPEAGILADILFHQKLLGQLSNGAQAWLNTIDEDDQRIHCYINTGGTVSGRCAHVGPNLGQVPSVVVEKIDGKKVIKKGREGDYGYECRSLFIVPPGWKMVGVDLSGLEFRCLAEVVQPFDAGALIEVILRGDIHQVNMDSTGITSRETIKRIIYGLLYGAGDEKLGIIAEPHWPSHRQKELGRQIRDKLMRGLPALRAAVDAIQKQANSGFLIGLDQRPLTVRAVYAALNLKLQSDGALISKKWVVLAEQYLMEAGLCHGWEGDFAFLMYVHDELQVACKPEHVETVKERVIRAANDAGKYFGFVCPIDAEAKVGDNWAQTH
jgi:hypothetical protein